MNTRPIQVYLDSSDLSRFGDVIRDRGDESDETLFEHLIEFAQKGDVQFPFSSLHISEAAPWIDVATEPSNARFEALGRLSRGSAFRAWTELVALDVFAHAFDDPEEFVKPVDRKTFHGRSNTGEWLPGLPLLFEDFSKSIRQLHADPLALAVEQGMLPDMNRQQRRAMKSRVKAMSTPATMQTRIESEWPSMFSDMCRAWPISRSDSDIWRRFVKSSKPDLKPVYESFRNGFADPRKLTFYLAPGPDTLNNSLTSWLRVSAEKLLDAVDGAENLRTLLSRSDVNDSKRQLRQSAIKFGRDFEDRWLQRERLDLASELADVHRSYLLTGEIDSPCPNCPSIDVIAGFPSVANRVSVFRSYVEKTIISVNSNRSREKYPSDVGDMMHAQYLPYCDVFRCDGFAATYLGGAAKKVGTTLVSSRTQLLPTISERLSRS